LRGAFKELSFNNEVDNFLWSRWIAKLGGFLGRKNDNNPGITVIWRWWARFMEIVDDYLLFFNSKLVGNS